VSLAACINVESLVGYFRREVLQPVFTRTNDKIVSFKCVFIRDLTICIDL